MAIQKRYNGDARGVVNVDRSRKDAPEAQIISTGVGKHPTAYKIVGLVTFAPELVTGGAVETILRAIAVSSTIVAYQVDATQMSVIAESTGWATDLLLQAAIQAIGVRLADATIPVTAYDFTSVTVTSVGGIKFA